MLTVNPADSVTKLKPERRDMRTMQKDDINMVLNAARKTDYYVLFHTYLYTGTRRSELLSVRWCDVDLFGMTMSINRSMQFIDNEITFKAPKTDSSRRLIDLSPDSCLVLGEHRKVIDAKREEAGLEKLTDNDLVFCHVDTKEPLLPDSITHAWLKLTRRCGLAGIRLHDARHSHATLMLKNGTSPKVIQERLGHSNFSTTMNLYAHVSPGMQKAAALSFDNTMNKKISQTDSLDSH
jgi:integrase